MDDYNLTKCPLCGKQNCKKKGHYSSGMMNYYECESCGAYLLGDDVFDIQTRIRVDGTSDVMQDNSKRNCNAVYNFILHHPLKVGMPTYVFTLNGERISPCDNANFSVKELLKKYPKEDNEYKQYMVLDNLNQKFGKEKFGLSKLDDALLFCETDKPQNEKEFWLRTLVSKGYLDLHKGGLTGIAPKERWEDTYTVTLDGVNYLKARAQLVEREIRLEQSESYLVKAKKLIGQDDVEQSDFIFHYNEFLGKELGKHNQIDRQDGGNKDDEIRAIIAKLEGYIKREKTEMEKEKTNVPSVNISPVFNNNPTFVNTNEISIVISQSVVFEEIEKSTLSDADRLVLKGILADIENLKNNKKDKGRIWEKVKGALGWIADKAVDVGLGLTLIPYLATLLQ